MSAPLPLAMTSTELNLLLYDDLPTAERAEADAYLTEHPEAADLRDEGRRLRALTAAAADRGSTLTPEALADYLATRLDPIPSRRARELEQRVRAATATDPELARAYGRLQDRLSEIEDALPPFGEHLEALTGRSLPEAPAQPLGFAGRPRAADREAVPRMRRVRFARLAVAASLLCAVLYGALFAAGEMGRPLSHELAALDDLPKTYRAFAVRGESGTPDPVADRYAEALATLDEGRSSTLGLFPRYDPAALDTALRLLEEAAERGEPHSALVLEARYLTGRIHLYRGELDAAEAALREVVEEGGPSAPHAQELLEEVELNRAELTR